MTGAAGTETNAQNCSTPTKRKHEDSASKPNFKRTNYLEWSDYFMAVAFLTAKRSKDPCSQVGACIVNKDKKIVGIGYNGMPIGCDDDFFPWGKNMPNKLDNKHLYVCHAEMNAILNKNSSDVKDCTIYVALFPCNECAKIIIQSGIKEVVYMSDKHSKKVTTIAAKRMFDASNVTYRKFTPEKTGIVINFTDLDSISQLPDTQGKPIEILYKIYFIY
ncbi:deoxycytidylate deaminase-like isoform X2 [Lycorma delicatula]|uniref:deoxycytidylate deaminase-like isoform X2 n=1 Tax=Lycorma delicatula TaxID=130591 RepID=UPI003F5190C5